MELQEILLYISIGCNIAIVLLYIYPIYLKIRIAIYDYQIRQIDKRRQVREQWILAKHHGLYQPTNKVDTSNPPKETGT